MQSFQIRPERQADFPEIEYLLNAAFKQKAEARLVASLRNRAEFISDLSLVAVLNNEVVGYILFFPVNISNEQRQQHHSLALAPVAVLPRHQNKGVGSALINHGLNTATQSNFLSVIVLGHAHYYPRFGFSPASRWRISSPFEVPDEVFMAKELKEGALQDVQGLVIYPPEFMEL